MKSLIVSIGVLIVTSIPCLAASYNTVSVAATATVILPTSKNRAGWSVHNVSTSTIYLGTDSSVTATTGLPILAGEKILADGAYSWRNTLYGIVTTGSAQEVRYMEWGLNEISQ